jgi:hypothetical protein
MKVGLDWPYLEEATRGYNQTSTRLEPTRKQEKRTPQKHLETFNTERPTAHQPDMDRSQIWSPKQNQIEEEYRGPMLHRERRGLTNSVWLELCINLNLGLIISRTPNKWQPLKSGSCSARHLYFWHEICIFSTRLDRKYCQCCRRQNFSRQSRMILLPYLFEPLCYQWPVFCVQTLPCFTFSYLDASHWLAGTVCDDDVGCHSLAMIVYFFVEGDLESQLALWESEAFADEGSRHTLTAGRWRYLQLQNKPTDVLGQWYSTWDTRTPGGTRRHLRGYVKLKKYIYYFMINTE